MLLISLGVFASSAQAVAMPLIMMTFGNMADLFIADSVATSESGRDALSITVIGVNSTGANLYLDNASK